MHNSHERMTMAPFDGTSLSCISQLHVLFECWVQSETLQVCLCLVLILCSPPPLCLCSSSSRYSSFSNPSGPGSVLHFYFVCRQTEINKGKLNNEFTVCCRIYIYPYTVPVYSSMRVKCVWVVYIYICLSWLLISYYFWLSALQSFVEITHQCSTAPGYELYILCRHCASFSMPEIKFEVVNCNSCYEKV